ncbi:MAG: DUF1989 domain-containing protein [Salinirussus sp.]
MVEVHIPAKHAVGFEVDRGDVFGVTDVAGQQVADLVAFNAADTFERFSPKYTYRRENDLRPTTGNTLYTTEGNPILEIVADDCGSHDLLYGPCNHWIVSEYYGQEGETGCRENLAEVLAPAGVDESDCQETFNAFMQSRIIDETHIEITEPESEAGDTITFEASMDAVVGVAACSGESTVNAGTPTPIEVEIPDGAELERNF